MRKNQRVIKNDNNQLEFKNFSKNKKKQTITQQPKFKPPNCPVCKQNMWIEFDKGYYCRNCEYIINKQKHQIDKKVPGKIEIFELDCQILMKRIEKFG